MSETKKVGRPTDNPKLSRVQAKLDEDTRAILEEYCRLHQISQSEAIRRAIGRLAMDYLN